MSPGTKPRPNDALSSGISDTSMSRDWSQSNQRTPRVSPDLDASGSRVYNKLGVPDSDDHLRVMMQTRIAVRDKTPHRFQVVPLREVANLGPKQTEGSIRVNLPTTPMDILNDSPSGPLGPYSQTRTLSLSRSLNQPEDGREVRKSVPPDDSVLDSSQVSLATKPGVKLRSADHPHSRRILAELDLNRDTRISTATTKYFSKTTTSKSITMRSLPPQDVLAPFSRTETSITQTTPRPSTGNHPPQDAKSNTLMTLGTHISEISRLFSSGNVATMRRNRSMTGSSIRSDTSVGTSDTSHETEAKLKRRHAIYRESSCMPYLGQSHGKNTAAFNSFSHRDLVGIMDAKANKGIDLNQDVCSAERPDLVHLKPPFELKQRNFSPFAGRPRIPCLSNSGAGGLLPVRALKLPKNKHVPRRTSANRVENAHPQIVLDLLRDIDEEIAQWAQA